MKSFSFLVFIYFGGQELVGQSLRILSATFKMFYFYFYVLFFLETHLYINFATSVTFSLGLASNRCKQSHPYFSQLSHPSL